MDNVSLLPSLNEIKDAANCINTYIHHTPVLSSPIINEIIDIELYFKCENFQKSGAFKFRGACNALLNLRTHALDIPVITHSSGNHGGALAKASSMLGRKCIVVMPSNAPKVKVDAVKYYGAKIVFCKPTLDARENTTQDLIEKTGAILVHPYNNYDIIAGQGTSALEFLTEHPELACIVSPVGGGGLLSGTAIASKSIKPDIRVIGAEPKGADDAYRSLQAGKIIPSINPVTIADGLLTSLGTLTFKAISDNVNEIITVAEDSILQAMHLIWQYLKIVVEPSAAVPLAALMENKDRFQGQTIGLILSGGNVDLNHLPFGTSDTLIG